MAGAPGEPARERGSAPPSSDAGRGSTFTAWSPAFADGAAIPAQYATVAAGGRNVSVPLELRGVPAAARSLAVEVVDLHPVAHSWVHWLVVDVPPGVSGVAAGASGGSMPDGARELVNSFGAPGWGGPQPPRGSGRHPYRFTVLALDVARLNVSPSPSVVEFREAAASHALATAEFVGTFER
jgi:Raf kinase inhibitor-like YbhB/YbcL family protein